MDIITIVEIGAVSLAVGMSAYQSVAYAQARKRTDRARKYHEDAKLRHDIAAFNANIRAQSIAPEETQLCGGCGLNLTLDQIGDCKGFDCQLYLGDPTDYMKVASESQKKINIGYQGHLHTDRKSI